MSSRCHCAVDITAKFIDVVTKQHGGQRSAWIHSGSQTLCGATHTRSRDAAFALEQVLVRGSPARSTRTTTGPQPANQGLPILPAIPRSTCALFLRLANLPNFALDRLSRYETTLWRQAGQILLALDALDRRKPLQSRRRFHIGSRQDLQADGC
jgi:hypothetical protein